MGDHSNETLQLQKRRDAEEYARDQLLGERRLCLDVTTIPWILNHIDCFVSQSRGNESIEELFLYPYAFDGQDDDLWEKVGQAVGNLQALETLRISREYLGDDDEVGPIPDWEILARILKYVQRRITLHINNFLSWDVEESKLFARAIHGHPSICRFEGGGIFSHESMDTLYSALATLPVLESMELSNRGLLAQPWDVSTLANTESLTELLRVPTLRSVKFYCFSFTPALFRATANAFMEGSAITNLVFTACRFSIGEWAVLMANGLSRNTSVTCIDIVAACDETLCNALAAALTSNSTLLRLDLGQQNYNDGYPLYLSPLFSALGQNTGLKTLNIGVSCHMEMDESLSTAIKNGLGTNQTLESLKLEYAILRDRNVALWCSAFSFLRINKSLKSLMVTLKDDATKSCASAFRIDIAAMLQENASLESLTIQSWNPIGRKAENNFALVTVLQHNTTLKTLSMYQNGSLRLTDDEGKQMVTLLKKNYAMESLPDIDQDNEAGDVGAILRLNGAGRRYLIDGSSISKGVEVLSRVNNDINCVFLHLLENPRLCDRSAVEKVSADESNGSSTSPTAGSDGGKRERASVYKGKASHRRLA
jgi:hypothetical protein